MEFDELSNRVNLQIGARIAEVGLYTVLLTLRGETILCLCESLFASPFISVTHSKR